ncbi:MAG: DUF5343 domain-containing protein [Bryobacteraceae bacterium]
MAAKRAAKTAAKKHAGAENQHTGTPAFPYTTEPQALRRLLAEIPKRPKPPKVTMETLKGWGVSSSNNSNTAIRVLKKIGLLDQSGQPTDHYAAYMRPGTGSAVLGQLLRDTYRVLFENSRSPETAQTEELKTLFNIHSGGGEDAMRLQIQTFKILAEFAAFPAAPASGMPLDVANSGDANPNSKPGTPRVPPVQVDLHIHLPENKSTREYEAIIQDIAKYIYGREIDQT